MQTWSQDLRQALRLLGRDWTFTAAVVVTLALGIGANAAIFTLLDQLLLRQLPVREPSRLVILDAPGANQGTMHRFSSFSTPISYPMYRDLRDGTGEVFEGLLARVPTAVNVTAGETETADAELVSGNYFDVLGVRAAQGRMLTQDDDRQRLGHPVVVLTHAYWQRRFGAAAGIVGRKLDVNGKLFEVVGVAEPGFHGVEIGRVAALFLPMAMKPWVTPTWDDMEARRVMWLNPVARLRAGVTAERAALVTNTVYQRILAEELKSIHVPAEHAATFAVAFVNKRLIFRSGARGGSDLRDAFSTQLLVLMGMVGFVLLIACANVANLLTARAATRQRELAVRVAMGASRARLVRQLLAEGLALALLGGAVGLVCAYWTTDALLFALGIGPAASALSAGPDARILAFTLLVSLLACMLSSLAPALQASRLAIAQALREVAGSVAGSRAQARLRSGLVVFEVALSLLLLVGAGLFARTLGNLQAINPGFDPRPLLTFSLDPSLAGYNTDRARDLILSVRDQLASLPGVASASAADVGVLTDSSSRSSVWVSGYQAKENERAITETNFVTTDHFATLNIGLLRGRPIDARDGHGAAAVAVVNQAFVRQFFEGRDALGGHFGFEPGTPGAIEIIGIVQDGRLRSLRDELRPAVYLPRAQQGDDAGGNVTFYLRAAGAPGTLATQVRALVRSIDSRLPVNELRTMTEVVERSLAIERLTAGLSMAFGLLATLLAAIGLYAVLAFGVARRTREIGVRMALGAEGRSVVRLVLRDVLRLAGLGLALGLPAALVLGRVVESELFGLRAADPQTLVGAVLLLTLIVMLSGYLPARQAVRVDPIQALRTE